MGLSKIKAGKVWQSKADYKQARPNTITQGGKAGTKSPLNALDDRDSGTTGKGRDEVIKWVQTCAECQLWEKGKVSTWHCLRAVRQQCTGNITINYLRDVCSATSTKNIPLFLSWTVTLELQKHVTVGRSHDQIGSELSCDPPCDWSHDPAPNPMSKQSCDKEWEHDLSNAHLLL